MTVLILLTATTRTSIIPSDLGTNLHRLLTNGLGRFIIPASAFLGCSVALRHSTLRTRACAGRSHLILAYPHPAHIGLLLTSFTDCCLLLIGLLNTAVTKEADDIPIDIAV